MRGILRNTRLIKAVISLVVLATGGFGTKSYIDSQNQELSVDDVIEIVDSSAVNCSGVLHASGSLKNISDIDNVKVTITVDFLDANQNVLKSVESVKEDLDAGETWAFDVSALGKETEYYSISNIEIDCD